MRIHAPIKRLGIVDLPAVACGVALPILLLHPNHVPVFASSGHVDVRLSDLALAVVAILVVFVRDRPSRLAVRRWLWFVPFLIVLLASGATAPEAARVTVGALKLIEYVAFGAAVTLLLRRRRDVRVLMASLVTSAAFLGLVGAAEVLRERRLGARADSFIGADPLGLLGAVILVIALAAPGLIGSRIARYTTTAVGLLCFVVAGSMSAALGLLLALGFAAARRLGPFARLNAASFAALAIVVLAVGGALAATRSSDLRAAVDQMTGSPANPRPGGSFAQRAMFADFGLRMWLDHPLAGVGFQQSPRLNRWAPYLASVRADFPALPETYFPAVPGISFGQPTSATTRPTSFGVHNVYSQLLAETGIVGFLLFAAGFVGTAGGAFRRARHSEVAFTGALLVLVVLGGFTRNELYGGLPETTLLAIALAFAARGGSARAALAPGESRRPGSALVAWVAGHCGLRRGNCPQSNLAANRA